ncbi:MAG: HlyD family type I secretion periplasmic adaptor subunit [Hyphococcus sp.]|nr:MAG: HlyD family type I secretion periplasmic adaptor subunit [Marinicaulis sp.]
MSSTNKVTKKTQKKHESVGERHGLALPIELEEGAPPMLSRAALAVLSGLVIFLLIWANVAKVRELSVAPGEIAPNGSTREVAHLEGGIVEEIFVRPGELVEGGQPILRMQSGSAGGEYDRFYARRANLQIRSERLSAQLEGRTPNFDEFKEEWPVLVQEQSGIFQSSTSQHQSILVSSKERVASAKSEIIKTKAELTAEKDLLDFAKQQLGIQDELIKDGFTSKQAYLEARASVAAAQASVAGATARLDQAERALTSASAEYETAKAEYNNRVAEERAQAMAELAELAQPIQSLKDRSERLTVTAPIAGIVKDIAVNGHGDVVRPGGIVAEITPSGDTLIAEVRISPKDIGHVVIGQKTEVTVTTFDPNRFGKVKGVISHISADTFIDEKTNEAYYTAFVALQGQSVGRGRLLRNLSPGMEVSAEIITQSRTLMQYFLKPVARSLDQAFTER